MTDTAAEQIVLEAFDPGALLLDANMRTNAEATVTKADVALCKKIAAQRADGCGNFVPVTLVRRPDGQLRVRTGHRRPSAACAQARVSWGSSPTRRATSGPISAPADRAVEREPPPAADDPRRRRRHRAGPVR